MLTSKDILRVERAVRSTHPSAVVERAPTMQDPQWLTIRLAGRAFVVDLQPRWGICVDELHGDEQLFDHAYAYVEQSANAAVDRVLALMAS